MEARAKEKLSSINLLSTHVLRVNTESPRDDLNKLWDLDSVGIREKDSVCEAFEKNISFEEGRYSVNLPWKDHHELLPDNYENSVMRLNSQLKRLRNQLEVLKEYNAVIEDQVQKGIIEKIDVTKVPEVGKVHYLPHHGVVRKSVLSTKLRVVFDASSKATQDAPSLNDCLHVGPAQSPKIFEILLRFRERKVAVVADVEKAFLNIGIDKEDRDVLRFLWIDDLEKEDPELVIYRFCRVVFGVNASPFLLNATLQRHINHYRADDTFVENLLQSFYVDDLVSGERDEEEAFWLYKKSKSCLAEGGFHLRKWVSNSQELLERIQDDRISTVGIEESKAKMVVEDTQTYAKTTVGQLEELQAVHKVLGIPWNCMSDEFWFNFDTMVQSAENLQPTKRNVLKITAKFYDPLGLISPIIVLIKILLQEICTKNLDWETLLPDHIANRWRKWLLELKEAKQVRVSRCIYFGIQERIHFHSLHGFGDASEKAYCAVVYLVLNTSSGDHVRLIASKTRVAPMKKFTIPRLELLSGLILAHLASAVKEALGKQILFTETHLWLDSITAIYWIKGGKDWK